MQANTSPIWAPNLELKRPVAAFTYLPHVKRFFLPVLCFMFGNQFGLPRRAHLHFPSPPPPPTTPTPPQDDDDLRGKQGVKRHWLFSLFFDSLLHKCTFRTPPPSSPPTSYSSLFYNFILFHSARDRNRSKWGRFLESADAWLIVTS